jgi:hypothetical protein
MNLAELGKPNDGQPKDRGRAASQRPDFRVEEGLAGYRSAAVTKPSGHDLSFPDGDDHFSKSFTFQQRNKRVRE